MDKNYFVVMYKPLQSKGDLIRFLVGEKELLTFLQGHKPIDGYKYIIYEGKKVLDYSK